MKKISFAVLMLVLFSAPLFAQTDDSWADTHPYDSQPAPSAAGYAYGGASEAPSQSYDYGSEAPVPSPTPTESQDLFTSDTAAEPAPSETSYGTSQDTQAAQAAQQTVPEAPIDSSTAPPPNYYDQTAAPAAPAESAPEPASQSAPAYQPPPEPQQDLSEQKKADAEALAANGKYLEARNIYEELIMDSSVSEDKKDLFRDAFAEVNWKLLFSPQESPESSTHKVAPGDSLYKIAKKYGTTISLLRRVNGLKNDKIFPNQKLKVIKKAFSVHVDKSDNTLALELDGKPLKKYRVATGENNKTPVGTFKIVNKLENPTWYYAGAVVPSNSPENILGTRWLGFDFKGYGIHGTTLPDSIGKQETMGCVRMLNQEVEELYDLIPVGTSVTVDD
ncbi:MAG TPA: L,D-transpeptidase family protein [Verrucomicrobiae bacterium]|nr:L,D-transpeptidase family protein [Verrucomicrobiae bacterium]